MPPVLGIGKLDELAPSGAGVASVAASELRRQSRSS